MFLAGRRRDRVFVRRRDAAVVARLVKPDQLSVCFRLSDVAPPPSDPGWYSLRVKRDLVVVQDLLSVRLTSLCNNSWH